ncbi:MAG TPA: hypothetical protein VF498_10080, partial [Anaerolineales bacterium]
VRPTLPVAQTGPTALPTQSSGVGSGARSAPAASPPAVTIPITTTSPSDTLAALENGNVPDSNLIELAERLQGKQNIAPTLPPPAAPFQVGDQHDFWAVNTDSDENFQVHATLRYVTAHGYFWIEDGVSYDPQALKQLADTFESKIYPTDREFFGSEWSPGVDGDVHLYILYARNLGQNIAGYYASTDEYPPEAQKYSNGHEMFFFNADNARLDRPYTYGTLAHEFQHMIHWYRDRSEETWMNEGFSDLAMFLNGYDVGNTDILYTENPDIQLNDWPTNPPDRPAHYGESFLFLTYFLDRFGEKATQDVVANPLHGLESIDDVLKQLGLKNSQTGQALTADDVFTDWVLASYLHNGQLDSGQYTYHNYPNAPRTQATVDIRRCPSQNNTRDVSQYGVQYIRIDCRGNFNLHFEGSVQVGVVPVEPHSGSFFYWSNKGNESDMTLTRSFDFSNASGPLTFSYWTWYDIEKNYDYVYLEASTDGKDWQILRTPSSTSANPSGNSYGWGYNGTSDGSGKGPEDARWIQENVDLSQYAGKQVQLRFEYVTDPGVNGEGFLLDDLVIPQIGYASNLEEDNGGWQGAGFVRIQNQLPQTFRLSLISEGRTTTVTPVSLSADNSADIPLQIGGDVKDVVLVVSGATRFTRQRAAYRFSIAP